MLSSLTKYGCFPSFAVYRTALDPLIVQAQCPAQLGKRALDACTMLEMGSHNNAQSLTGFQKNGGPKG